MQSIYLITIRLFFHFLISKSKKSLKYLSVILMSRHGIINLNIYLKQKQDKTTTAITTTSGWQKHVFCMSGGFQILFYLLTSRSLGK